MNEKIRPFVVVMVLFFALPHQARAENTNRATSGAWVAIGGGSSPANNEISMEDDLLLFRQVFDPQRGTMLYSGGPHTRTVRVLGTRRPDPVRSTLAWLMSDNGANFGSFRATRLRGIHAASVSNVLKALTHANQTSTGGPTTVFVATHGDRGASPWDTGIALWGNDILTVADLAQFLSNQHQAPPQQWIVNSCYAGGFAELMFDDVGQERTPSQGPRCGVYATTWDRESTGCDPNPDRNAHHTYGRYLLEALRGHDVDGHVRTSDIDLDGNGQIGLAEAHAYVRLTLPTRDVPTSSSDRFLRIHASHEDDDTLSVGELEENWLIQHMVRRLNLDRVHAYHQAKEQLAMLKKQIVQNENKYEQLAEEEKALASHAASVILNRWPMLENPWDPDFENTLRNHRLLIAQTISREDSVRSGVTLRHEMSKVEENIHALHVRAAPYERLTQALESIRLAGNLQTSNPSAWRSYQEILACERMVPGGLLEQAQVLTAVR